MLVFRSSSISKAWFVFSLAVLCYLFGYLSTKRGWPPKAYLDRALHQARIEYRSWFPPMSAPQVYEREGVQVVDPQKVQPGVTVITSAWKSSKGWKPGLRLIGRKGEKLHQWLIDRGSLFPDSLGPYRADPEGAIVHGSHLFPNGDVLLNLEYVGTVRLDACSNIIWRLPAQGHHSISRAENGTFWIPGGEWSDDVDSINDYPGFPGRYWASKILNISQDGNIIREFNFIDILFKNNLEEYIPKVWNLGGIDRDPIHLNDVEPLPSSIAKKYPTLEEGDLLISARHINLVLILDPESKRVKWHFSKHLIGQHDPDFIGGGWVGIFNNREDLTKRGEMLGGSQVITVQPSTDSTKVLFPSQHSEPFYTARQGRWQQLDNGNLLLSETNAGRVVEVTPDGRTVWEYVRTSNDSQVPNINGATRHDLTHDQIASWPCSSIDSIRTASQNQ